MPSFYHFFLSQAGGDRTHDGCFFCSCNGWRQNKSSISNCFRTTDRHLDGLFVCLFVCLFCFVRLETHSPCHEFVSSPLSLYPMCCCCWTVIGGAERSERKKATYFDYIKHSLLSLPYFDLSRKRHHSPFLPLIVASCFSNSNSREIRQHTVHTLL